MFLAEERTEDARTRGTYERTSGTSESMNVFDYLRAKTCIVRAENTYFCQS